MEQYFKKNHFVSLKKSKYIELVSLFKLENKCLSFDMVKNAGFKNLEIGKSEILFVLHL